MCIRDRSHTLCKLLLNTDIQTQCRQHDDHKTCIHLTVLDCRFLCSHQVHQSYRKSLQLRLCQQCHGDYVLIPECKEVEQDHCNDTWFCHREDDLHHGCKIVCSVHICGFLIILCQSPEISRQQVDRKRKRSCGIHKSKNEQVVQEKCPACQLPDEFVPVSYTHLP